MKHGLNLFKGKNIIMYNSDHFSREEALKQFINAKSKHNPNYNNKDVFVINLNKDLSENTISFGNFSNEFSDIKYFSVCLYKTDYHELKETDKCPIKIPDLCKNINRIQLSTPILRSDKRWETLGITASSLFLGSMLTEKSYKVNVKNITLPLLGDSSGFKNFDLFGFTLFEDIFPEFKTFISQNFSNNDSIIAAGGPFVTLSPLSSFFHLPEVNLFVRGEGEFVFPEILDSLKTGNLIELLKSEGYIYQEEGLIIISDYDVINMPSNLNKIKFNFSFIDKKSLHKGLEVNFSRGCKNSCTFCSKVQGKQFRKLELSSINNLLESFSNRLEKMEIESIESRILNINDDDILQDLEYTKSVLELIHKKRYKIWGIQSSISSFFSEKWEIENEKIDLISNKDFYPEGDPLLWLGTDTFLKKRGKRLGKKIPDMELFLLLLEKFEKLEIRNYHYWISSDHMTNWDEFMDELILIYNLNSRFPKFSILPHAPFLIPYPSTPSFKQITNLPESNSKLVYRKIIKGSYPIFDLILVERVESKWEKLNELLKNKKLSGKEGFFDYMKNGDFKNAVVTAYSFLKSERISKSHSDDSLIVKELSLIERNIENFITKII